MDRFRAWPARERGESVVLASGGFRWLLSLSTQHPVAASFVVSVAVRLIFAITTNLAREGVLIPDEGQYLLLAAVVSKGDSVRALWPGYSEALMASTSGFVWPLAGLFWLFGPSRFVGQLLAILFGAAAAAAAAFLARRFLREPYALGAGLTVALFPSQVLFSSAVLRESMIWAGLAALAVVVAISKRDDSPARIVFSGLVVALLFLVLSMLRIQTAALALWCVVPALFLSRGRRMLRALCATAVLVFAPLAVPLIVSPMVVEMGPGGVTFAKAALGRLTSAQVSMSVHAESGFISLDQAMSVYAEPGFAALDPAETCASRLGDQADEGQGLDAVAGHLLERPAGDWVCIYDRVTGLTFMADNRLGTSVSRIPSGLYNTMIRPAPWEIGSGQPRFEAGLLEQHGLGSSTGLLGAALESPVWVALYGLSAYGLWKFRNQYRQIAFPFLIVLAISFSGAMVHGNLGTAFRHRGQMLFAFAVLAVGGVQAIVDNRSDRRINRDS